MEKCKNFEPRAKRENSEGEPGGWGNIPDTWGELPDTWGEDLPEWGELPADW